MLLDFFKEENTRDRPTFHQNFGLWGGGWLMTKNLQLPLDGVGNTGPCIWSQFMALYTIWMLSIRYCFSPKKSLRA